MTQINRGRSHDPLENRRDTNITTASTTEYSRHGDDSASWGALSAAHELLQGVGRE